MIGVIRRRRRQAHLRWRAGLLGVALVLALAGIGLRTGWLVNVAIGVLVAGFGLRFLERSGDEAEDEDEGEGEVPTT